MERKKVFDEKQQYPLQPWLTNMTLLSTTKVLGTLPTTENKP